MLIIGSNTAESHPVIATRVKSSHKLSGQKLIVSDLRENEMARRADLERMQQILCLKDLGLALQEIRYCLDVDQTSLRQVLESHRRLHFSLDC